MEPRELWERNALLAEAFCAGDEKVRKAQAVLDEAQAERTRTLAAFAITVGSDGAVADLMGLQEREVRLARRTVGKDDARAVAEQLLAAPRNTATPEAVTAVTHDTVTAVPPESFAPPPPHHARRHRDQAEEPAPARPRDELRPPAPHPAVPTPVAGSRAQDEVVTWSAGMDSVLRRSWQAGLDLRTVAEDLGLTARAVLMRVQTLGAEGRLAPHPATAAPRRSGRHRRNDDLIRTPAAPVPHFAVSTHGALV